MKNEIIKIEKGTEIVTLTTGINDLIELVNEKYGNNVFNIETTKGRKSIISNAYDVTKSKTFIARAIDETIKQKELEVQPTLDIIKHLKESKKHSNRYLTELSTDLRQSVTDYEEELSLVKLQEEIDLSHGVAIEMNISHDKEVENKRLIDLAIKTEYENKLKEEAALKAKLEAEQKAADDIRIANEKVEQAKKDIIEAKIKADLEKEIAEAKRLQDIKDAETKRLNDIETAKKAEILRIDNIRKAYEDEKKEEELKAKMIKDLEIAEQKKRDDDIEHKKTINNKILSELSSLGLSDEHSKIVIKAIIQDKISNTIIKY